MLPGATVVLQPGGVSVAAWASASVSGDEAAHQDARQRGGNGDGDPVGLGHGGSVARRHGP